MSFWLKAMGAAIVSLVILYLSVGRSGDSPLFWVGIVLVSLIWSQGGKILWRAASANGETGWLAIFLCATWAIWLPALVPVILALSLWEEVRSWVK